MGRTKEACENLIAVADRFPKLPTILYNLACYSCRLGHMEDARKLLEKAIQHGDAKSVKLMALDVPDLEASLLKQFPRRIFIALWPNHK